MQQATFHAMKKPRWTHGMGIERRMGLPRGMLLSQAPDAGTLVDRVLARCQLDGRALRYLAGMLTITVRDWMRPKA